MQALHSARTSLIRYDFLILSTVAFAPHFNCSKIYLRHALLLILPLQFLLDTSALGDILLVYDVII